MQGYFDFCTLGAPSVGGITAPPDQTSRDHPCIVKHHYITRIQQIRQIADMLVVKRPVGWDMQHPRAVTRAHGRLRDQLSR
jgi:hypothetical protein